MPGACMITQAARQNCWKDRNETKSQASDQQGIFRRRWPRATTRRQGRAQDRTHARHACLCLEKRQSRRRKTVKQKPCSCSWWARGWNSREERVRDTPSPSGRNIGSRVRVSWSWLLGGTYMNSVEDLDVFKLAHELALKVYSVSKKFQRRDVQPGRPDATSCQLGWDEP